MKSYCKGYAITEDVVLAAYGDWASHESGRKNRRRVLEEYGTPEAMAAEVVAELRSGRVRFRAMRRYRRRDPGSGKVREITIESVKQQVCDYVLVSAIQPMLDDRLGFWQLGGPHVRRAEDLQRAVKRWQQAGGWWAHGDVRHAYGSTSTEMLRRLLMPRIRSPDVRILLDSLLSAHGESLALGSYLSLRLFQLVMSFAYSRAESLGKVRRGKRVRLVAHQCFWADDFWLMGPRKRDVQAAMRDLEAYLRGEFGLELHPWQACRVGDDEPMDVAGRVVRPGRATLRDASFLRAYRALRRFRRRPCPSTARSLASHKGQIASADCRGFERRCDLPGAMRAAGRIISASSRTEAA